MAILLLFTTATPLLANENEGILPPPSNSDLSLWDEIWNLRHESVELRQQIRELQDQLVQQGEGNIRLVAPQNITIEEGESREVTVTVRNVGSHAVNSLFTIATPSEGSPFTVEFLRNSNSVAQINVNAQRNMTIRITMDENADPGSHSIGLNHFFRDQIGRTSTSTDSIYVRIGRETRTPNVRLGNFQTMHTGPLSPGQTFTISANIQNLGDATARDVRVSLPENMRADDNIFITSDLNQALFTTMPEGHSSVLNFTLQTFSGIETGAYTIAFHVSFRDENNEKQPEVIVPFIANVYAPKDKDVSILEIRDISAPVGTIAVGQTGWVRFYLYNSGNVEARNVRVEATPENEQAIVPMTSNIQTLPSLAPGESRQVSFSFSPRDFAITRSYAIRFRTTFDIARMGKSDAFDQFAAFNVYNPDKEEDYDDGRTQIPRVIVSEYSLHPAIPRAGHEFEMTITFRNTNATRAVNNIRILMEELLGTGLPNQQNHFAGFAPVGGSNTLFIDRIAPLGEVTRVLRFTTSAEATSGAHTKRISFDYQDDAYVTHEATEQISISVGQVTRLELANINVSETGMVGNPEWFGFTIANTGRVNLINVRVRTEGPFDVTQAGRLIGQLNAQRTAGFDGRFTPLEPGMHQGQFIVYGEDPTGAITELVYSFNIMVEPGWDMNFEGGNWPDDRDEGGMGWDMEEPSETNAFVRLLRSVFTVETAPADWNEDSMGEFSSEAAAMWGMEPERGVRWLSFVILAGVVALVIALPIIIVVRKKRNRLDFDDEG